MRPVSLVLLISGVGLLLGGALVASFKILCRVEDLTYMNMHVHIHCNAWGQPLLALFTTHVPADANGTLMDIITEVGPYPNYVRQGKWKHGLQKSGKPTVESDVWYLDNFVVTAAEWEQRQ